MKQWRLLSWGIVLAAGVITGCDSCSKSNSGTGGSGRSDGIRPPSAPPKELLDVAIATAGGVNKLRAASSFRATYRSRSAAGHVEQGEFFYRSSAARLRLTTSSGQSYDLLTSQEGCARFYDPVVVRCTPSRAERSKRYHVAYEASWLWPLQTDPWSFEAGTKLVDGTTYDVLLARKKGHDFDATVFLDPKTHQVTRLSVPFRAGNQAQSRLSKRSKFEDVCGAKLPLQEKAYLDGKPIFTVELSDVKCGSVTPHSVAIPKQVADGTVEKRTLTERTLLCHTRSSSYDRIGASFDGLDAHLKKRKLTRQREVGWVVFESAPQPNQPLPTVARACVEVAGAPPDEPERDGDLELRRDPSREVLSAFGAGPFDSQVTRLAGLLHAEAKRLEIDPSGEVRQLGYMVAKDAPESDRITELQMVLPKPPAAEP